MLHRYRILIKNKRTLLSQLFLSPPALSLCAPDKNVTKHQMLFNLNEMRSSIGDYHLLSSAELRLLIKTTNIPSGSEQRLELYKGLGDSRRYLGSRFITNKWSDRWLSFDVTETLKEWLKGTGESRQITVCKSGHNLYKSGHSHCK